MKLQNIILQYKKLIIGLIIIVFIDFYVHYSGNALIYVDNSFGDEVFAAICTVATLGSAIQALIIGCFNNKILGLSIRDIIKLPNCKVRIPELLIVAMAGIGLGILALSLQLYNTLSYILVAIIYVISLSSIEIWKLLSDDTEVQKLISSACNTGNNYTFEFFLVSWYEELENAIEKCDITEQNKYIDLIKNLLAHIPNDEQTVNTVLQQQTAKMFSSACFTLGFVDAYKRILCLRGDENDIRIDADQIALDYLGEIRYCPANELSQYKIRTTIIDIIETIDNTNPVKSRFVYQILQMIRKNAVIAENIRLDILDSVFFYLCSLQDNPIDSIKKEVLLIFIRDAVFLNANEHDRTVIFELFIENMYARNMYHSDENNYISVIAELFRALFFYAFYESETLDQHYREDLVELFQHTAETKNSDKASLAKLVLSNTDQLIKWYANDLLTTIQWQRSFFDYFPRRCGVKTAVWVETNLRYFAFGFYYAIGDFWEIFPVDAYLKNPEHELTDRLHLCKSIMDLFEDDMSLTKTVRETATQIHDQLNISTQFHEDKWNRNFNYFNQLLCQLQAERNLATKENVSAGVFELQHFLSHELEKRNFAIYNHQLSMDHAQHFTFTPKVRLCEKDDIQSSARHKAFSIRSLITKMVRWTLPPLSLSFDDDGTKSLLDALSERDYCFRNFTFVDDWAIPQETRKTTAFCKLKEKIETIPFFSSEVIRGDTLLTVDKLEYNYDILKYELHEPSNEQCEEYIQSFKIAEGKYRIDGAVYDYSGAIEFTKKHCVVELFDVAIVINIDENSGYKITYNRKFTE